MLGSRLRCWYSGAKFRSSSARSSECSGRRGDRMLMAALRDRLPQSAWAALLVQPETVLGWHRALVRRKWAAYLRRPRRGRPPTSTECRQLIVRMAKENPGWGYFRIKGELRKLGHTVAATTIRSVLLWAGIPPSGRRAKLSWKEFLAVQAQTLVVADFLASTPSSSSASTSLSICIWQPGGFCWPLARPIQMRRGWLSKPATWPGRWKRKGSSRRPSSMTETRSFRRELTASLDRQELA